MIQTILLNAYLVLPRKRPINGNVFFEEENGYLFLPRNKKIAFRISDKIFNSYIYTKEEFYEQV